MKQYSDVDASTTVDRLQLALTCEFLYSIYYAMMTMVMVIMIDDE